VGSGGSRIALAVLAVALVAAGTAGCGLGAGQGTGEVSLQVTEHFGRLPLAGVSAAHVPGSETVMRMLERHFRISTRYGGGFVESIDGHSGTSDGVDWFYYVNGTEAAAGAATTAVHRGDHVWWDLHDWRAAESVPAVVGSFPEPFADGLGGRRYRTVVECAAVQSVCRRVVAALRGAGARVTQVALGARAPAGTLRVLVGAWQALRRDRAAARIARGPAASGVYARFAGAGGGELELLDPRGVVARTLGAGAGLIAATAGPSGLPEWVVSGTGPAGVAAAAGALNPADLHDAFAVAVSARRTVALPLEPAL